MVLIKKSLILIVLLFLVSTALAEIYKWTDEQGVLHFTDDLSKVPEKYRPKIPQKNPPVPESDKMSDYKVVHLAKLYLNYVCSLRSEETSYNEFRQEASKFYSNIQGLNMELLDGINSFDYFKWREDVDACEKKFKRNSFYRKLRIGMKVTELERLFEDYGYPENYQDADERSGRYYIYKNPRIELYIQDNQLKRWN